jgi:hypothetical protein
MRPLQDGGILTKKVFKESLNMEGASFMTVYLGICKHGMFAPHKEEEPEGPSVNQFFSIIVTSQQRIK